MPAFKTRPRIRCRVGPPSCIPMGGTSGFSVNVVLAECVGTAGGTSTGAIAGLPVLNPLASRAWDALTQITSIGESLELVRFSKDGRVTFGASAMDAGGEDEFAGFCLRRVETPLDSRTALDGTNSDLIAGIAAMLWTATAGAFRGVQHGAEGQARGLTNVGAVANSKAQSGYLPANQGTRWTITAGGTSTAQGTHAVRIGIAEGLYVVTLEHGKPPRLVKRVGGVDVAFVALRDMPNVDLRSGAVQVLHLFRLCDRLIVGWQGEFRWVAEYESAAAAEAGDPSRRVPVEWASGRCTVEKIGCRAVVDLATVDFDSTSDEAKRQIVLDVGALNYAYQGNGETGIATGVLKYGGAKVAMTSTANRGFITLTVNGPTDKHDTPVINKVSGKYPDTPYSAGTTDYLDVSAAVRSATLELAAPPSSNMASMQITLDRKHLDRIDGDWGDYLTQFGVVRFEGAWDYDDETTGPWTAFFEGIVPKIDSGTNEVNEQHLTMACFDPAYLLRAPAAMIDHSFPPLDMFWLYKLRQSNNQTAIGSGPYNPIYPPIPGGPPQNVTRLAYEFADAVRDILYLLRGPGGGVLADFTAGLFPLLTSDSDPFGYCRAEQVASGDSQPPTAQGWCLPAPQNTDALSWIQEICDKGSLVFFYGHVPGFGASDWPRPILSTFEALLANRPTHIVSDTAYDGLTDTYVSAWVNHVAQSIEREDRPDVVVNHFEATSSGFFGDSADSSGYPPRIAEAYLPDSDVNSEKNIRHRRSKIADVGPLGGFPGGVEAYVLTQKYEYAINSRFTWPRVPMEGRCSNPAKGDAPIVPGDKLKFEFGTSIESDSGINLDGRTFRVATVSHAWTFSESSPAEHTMDVGLRPISGTGL